MNVMNRFTLVLSDKEFLQKAIGFIEHDLAARKVPKKNIIRTELLAEETIVLLAQHAAEGAVLRISTVGIMGDIKINLAMAGEEFDSEIDITGSEDDEGDEGTEDAIRAILLKAFGENYKYSHSKGINKVRIAVVKSGQNSLYLTLAAMVLGIVFGVMLKLAVPQAGTDVICTYILQPVKTVFMNSLGIIIAPVVFFSLVTCFSQFKNLSELGRLAGKVMSVYVITTAIAASLGVTIAVLIKPGKPGFALTDGITAGTMSVNTDAEYSFLDTIVNIVPSNFVRPFLESDTLQLMFIAVLVGIAAGMIGEYSGMLTDIFEAGNSLFLTITTVITKFIPLAVFCSVSLMIVNLGSDSVLSVLQGAAVEIATILIMICIYGVLILFLARLSPIRFFKNIREGMLTSFTLSSSSAAMPTNLRICKDKLGISPKLCNFSIPLGATVNMDGGCIFMSSFAVFLAGAYGVELTPASIIPMVITIILLSLGAPGVPGSALVCLGVVLGQIGVPLEALGLIIAVVPIVDMFDTMNNTTGDMAASLIVAKSEKLLDIDIYNSAD